MSIAIAFPTTGWDGYMDWHQQAERTFAMRKKPEQKSGANIIIYRKRTQQKIIMALLVCIA